MHIKLNGSERDVPLQCTIAELVKLVGLVPERVAIERNGEVAPRRSWNEVALAAGDRLEVVTFVGGG